MLARLRTVAVAAAVVATALVVTPGRAAAATWDGQMAANTSCANGATTAVQRTISTNTQLGTVIGKVELRYSSSCRTVWTRVTSTAVSSAYIGGYVQRNSDGAYYQCSESGWSDNLGAYYCLTAMLNDKDVTSYAKGGIQYQGATYTGQTSNY
ncbi:DUF2690 domain-containing protein [Dactylosporangium darangshiense]|uniref:DUF2690 domain-containing protein n=1 Tax=Dactylosporangium darangshiense TaxID=579108 RepID=A0ABP8D4Q0_9ACTN